MALAYIQVYIPWQRIDSPEINLHTLVCGQMVLTKLPRPSSGRKTIISINAAEETGYPHTKK